MLMLVSALYLLTHTEFLFIEKIGCLPPDACEKMIFALSFLWILIDVA